MPAASLAVLLPLTALLAGCAGAGALRVRASSTTLPASSPAVKRAAARLLAGDAESLLRSRLNAAEPLRLFFQIYQKGELICTEESFSEVREGGTKFELKVERPDTSVLSGGAISSLAMPTRTRGVHGYSPRSILMDGSEGFFSRDDCLASGVRYPPRDVDGPAPSISIAELLDGHGQASRWYRGSESISFLGRREAWPRFAGGTYEARFYEAASSAWLWGPLETTAARGGLYRASVAPAAFSIGAELFCRSANDCPATLAGSERPLLRAGSREEIVDFAEQFWSYDAPLFAPMRDGTGVSCVELRPRAGELLRFEVFGEPRQHPIVRSAAGLRFGRGKPGGWVWAKLVVHGRDKQAFWLSGSPWFLRQSDCLAQREQVKPVNFRATGIVTVTDSFGEPRLPLATSYFTLDTRDANATCQPLRLRPLQSGGRLELETDRGLEVRDYDFYVDEWAFWVGPVLTGSLPDTARYRGVLMAPRATPHGVELDGWSWYATEAECTAELGRRRSAAASPTSSSAPASADR